VVQQNTPVPAAKVTTAPVVQQTAPVAKATIANTVAQPAVVGKKALVPAVKLSTAHVKVVNENKKTLVTAAKRYTTPVATDFRMPVP
jgi:1-deoxy-D-xylulose 5-phosphate reductoisomerase